METAPPADAPRILATIHIGASAISMLVFEEDDPSKTIEFLEQPFPLARDVFRDGQVSRATTERAQPAGPTPRQPMLLLHHGHRRPPRRRRHQFLASSPFSAWLSSRIWTPLGAKSSSMPASLSIAGQPSYRVRHRDPGRSHTAKLSA